MDVSTTIKKLGLEQVFRYLYKDPEQNLMKLMDWADKFSKGEFAPQRAVLREIIGPAGICICCQFNKVLRHFSETLKTIFYNESSLSTDQ